jgi:hypothetical protein
MRAIARTPFARTPIAGPARRAGFAPFRATTDHPSVELANERLREAARRGDPVAVEGAARRLAVAINLALLRRAAAAVATMLHRRAARAR